jgi:hypothetical protein
MSHPAPKRLLLLVLSGALALLASLVSAAPAAAAGHGGARPWRDLASAYAGTARYHHLPFASRDGYSAFPEGMPLHECIDEDLDLDDIDGKPAMGVHWVNGALLDDQLDAAHPEVLVFEPRPGGRLRLVALEYVVFESAWGSPEDTDPPELFGRPLQYVPAPNRYDLPAFYELHAWIWKFNPDGAFANMNPRVDCANG